MNCAECDKDFNKKIDDDYLCTSCRHKLQPLPESRERVGRVLDLITNLNTMPYYPEGSEDGYNPFGDTVMIVESKQNSPWTMVYLAIQEDTQFPDIKQTRVVKRFAIWTLSGDIYEMKHGAVGDDPIPENEYRTKLVI